MAYANEIERRRAEEKIRFYIPNPGPQYKFISSRKRLIAFFGGNRTGKTYGGAFRAVAFALGKDGAKYLTDLPKEIQDFYGNIKTPNTVWVCGEAAKDIRDTIQGLVMDLIPEGEFAKKQYRGKETEKRILYLNSDIIDTIYLKNGSKIVFKSYEQGREKFQSAVVNAIWADEEMPYDIFRECQMRLLSTTGYFWTTMTPLKGLTWVHDVIYLNEHEDQEVEYFTATWDDNPHLPSIELKRLAATLPKDELKARKNGQFLSRSGLVYSDFVKCNPKDNDELPDDYPKSMPRKAYGNIIPFFAIPREWKRICAIDPGIKDPWAQLWVAVHPDGDLIVYDEMYETEFRGVNYYAKKTNEHDQGLYVEYMIDPKGNTRDTTGTTIHAKFAGQGIMCALAINDKEPGIAAVKQRLCSGEGERTLFVMENCANAIKEFSRYEWVKVKEGQNQKDRPREAYNHLMDCLRYITVSNPSPFPSAPKEKLPPPKPGWEEYYNRSSGNEQKVNPLLKAI